MKKTCLIFIALTLASSVFANAPKINIQIEGNFINRIANQIPFPYYAKINMDEGKNKGKIIDIRPLNSSRSIQAGTYDFQESAYKNHSTDFYPNNIAEAEEKLRIAIISELEMKLATLDNSNPQRQEITALLTYFKEQYYYDKNNYYHNNEISNRSWFSNIVKEVGKGIGKITKIVKTEIKGARDSIKTEIEGAKGSIKDFQKFTGSGIKFIKPFVDYQIKQYLSVFENRRISIVVEKRPIFNIENMTVTNLKLRMLLEAKVCLRTKYTITKCAPIRVGWIRPEHKPVMKLSFDSPHTSSENYKALFLKTTATENVKLRFKFKVFGIPVSLPFTTISKSETAFKESLIKYRPKKYLQSISFSNQKASIGISHIEAKSQNKKINLEITLNGCTTYTDKHNNRLSTAITRSSDSNCKPHQ